MSENIPSCLLFIYSNNYNPHPDQLFCSVFSEYHNDLLFRLFNSDTWKHNAKHFLSIEDDTNSNKNMIYLRETSQYIYVIVIDSVFSSKLSSSKIYELINKIDIHTVQYSHYIKNSTKYLEIIKTFLTEENKFTKINKTLSNISDSMQNNISQIIKQGESISSIEDKCINLNNSASLFQKKTTDTKHILLCKNFKMFLALFILLFIIILIIVLAITL